MVAKRPGWQADRLVRGVDVFAYIPTVQVLKEGGYEAGPSMLNYNHPGPWAESVEAAILGAVRDVMKRVGREPIAK